MTDTATELEASKASNLDLIDRLNLDREHIEPATAIDNVAMLLDRLEGMKRRIREAEEALKPVVQAWIETNKQDIVIGDVTYYVGLKKKEKCRQIPATVEAIFNKVGGDFEAFCDTLSVNAIKPGAAKKVLGDEYDTYFETLIENDLMTDRPKRELQSVNKRFLKQ